MNKIVKRWGTCLTIVLICRIIGKRKWQVVPNFSKNGNYKAAKIVLADVANEYMAYINTIAGVEYRFIRQEDLGEYGISQEVIA
ncbi:hypothetical protein FD723_40190 (plasmid) [Nostoc sp. C052]|uniref:hypothetical protein n=1 Tax=Nostoc sp. C052 TaxID=2576902 RepID=UPI0015C327A4|nr:hypothetical protein [Nostoc sp. C052]QLE46434.1 hypothetical protein FD723_40190 [Nostoc sp. C052]